MFFVPLSKEMENWQIRRTSRGIRLIDGKGYTYTKDRHVGNKSYWRCDYRPWKCKARASVVGTTNIGECNKGHVMFNLMSHGHMPTLKRKIKTDNDNDEDSINDSPPTKSLLKPQTKTVISPKSSPSVTKPPPSPESEMCLRWNSHHLNMQTVFPILMDDERYVDVTLAAEGKLLKCHKLILSSCSNYFDDMLKNTNHSQQTIIFLRDIKFWQIRALVDFMYKGEVNVDQSKLESLLKAAEDLQIKGLAGKTPAKEPETYESSSVPKAPVSESNFSDSEGKSGRVSSTYEDDGDEEYFPHSEYKRGKYKKNRKRKSSAPPDPSLLKHVKINLKGTKSRPNIKQPKFFSPDYPEYDPDRCVSPPKVESDPVFHIDNIKLEPIDIEVPQSPTFFEMNSMMDKSISENDLKVDNQMLEEIQTNKDPIEFSQPPKDTGETSKVSINKPIHFESTCKNIDIPSTSKESVIEKPKPNIEASPLEKISLPTKIVTEIGQKDVLNLNKKAIIVKCQNVKKFIDDNASIQKIIDAATSKQTLNESEKSKLPQIRVRNLPTTDTMLKKFATTQLTSILKKGESSLGHNKHIILKKIPTKPTILRHSLPTKIKEITAEVQEDNKSIVEKICLLAKTKKELTSSDTKIEEKQENLNLTKSVSEPPEETGKKKDEDKVIIAE